MFGTKCVTALVEVCFNLKVEKTFRAPFTPERSMKALKKAIDGAAFGTVLCLFTDAPTHDLALKSEVITQKRSINAQIFIFLTPDYDIKNSVNLASYRAYQEVSDRHTYIMSQTEPSVIKRLVIKYLQSTEKGIRRDC